VIRIKKALSASMVKVREYCGSPALKLTGLSEGEQKTAMAGMDVSATMKRETNRA